VVKLRKNYDFPKQPASGARFVRRTPSETRFENRKPVLRYKRARIYSAQLGRFISRDPLGFVDGMSLYRAYFVPGKTDPSGRCEVKLTCTNLAYPFEHCGIEVFHPNGTINRWHVHSPNAGLLGKDTCNVQPTRIDTPIGVGPWRVVDTWKDPSGQLCNCLDRIAALIRSKKLPYWPTPKNSFLSHACKSTTFCNSNYTTHCMMKKCGIDSAKNTWRTAPGWNHRMMKCTKTSKIRPNYGSRTLGCRCKCDKWELIDEEWCAGAPANPTIKPEPK
jgi:RHS repeat-associated protein